MKMALTKVALEVKTSGPGVMPFIISTPIIMAVIVSPGMPNTRAGM